MRLLTIASVALVLAPAAAVAQSPVPPPAGPPNYTIIVTAQEMGVIASGLVALPYRDVAGLIQNLQQQTRAQADAAAAPKLSGATPPKPDEKPPAP